MKGVTESQRLDALIERFGCNAPRRCYPPMVAGLDAFIDHLVGPGRNSYVTGKEVATPYKPSIARRHYATPFLIPGVPSIAVVERGVELPGAGDWNRFGAIWALLLPFRESDGRPLEVVNWYRPRNYNASVGGSKGSDHLTAHACDIGVRSSEHRGALVNYLDEFIDDPDLALSVGVYRTRIHVGVRAPATVAKGRRRTWGPNDPW